MSLIKSKVSFDVNAVQLGQGILVESEGHVYSGIVTYVSEDELSFVDLNDNSKSNTYVIDAQEIADGITTVELEEVDEDCDDDCDVCGDSSERIDVANVDLTGYTVTELATLLERVGKTLADRGAHFMVSN